MARTPTTVALGFARVPLSEEVLHFLERDPAFRVIGTAGDTETLSRLVREARPEAVVAAPQLLATAYSDGAVKLAVAEEESVATLRDAIRAGAAGFYLWPEERARLAGDAGRLPRRREHEDRPRGRIIAVFGPRGGAGTTFVATHLAAAVSGTGAATCLVDADPFFGDVTAALGVAADEGARTIGDLLPVLEELGPEHLADVLYRHPAGFSVLLAPHDAASADAIQPAHLAAAVGLLAARHDVVLLHLSRAMDDVARSALGMADGVVLVLTLDVLSFRAGRRVLDLLGDTGLGDRCRIVVNRAARSEVVPEDAERVFGQAAALVLRADRRVSTAQNRGELLPRSSRTMRELSRFARSLLEVPA